MERNRFVQMRKSAIIIQQAVRVWIRGRKRLENNEPFERYEFPEGKTCEHVDTLEASAAVCCSYS